MISRAKGAKAQRNARYESFGWLQARQDFLGGAMGQAGADRNSVPLSSHGGREEGCA
jgi:hypothetical protein